MAKKLTKAEALPKIIELNEKDPSMSYPQMIKKLDLDISPSGFSRWVKDLKKAGTWKSPEDSKDNDEIKKLATKIINAGSNLSKQELARKFRVGKDKIDKALSLIANNTEVSAKSSDTISTTTNNVVSISPKKESNVSVGTVYTFLTRPKNANAKPKKKFALVVDITDRKRVVYVEVLECVYKRKGEAPAISISEKAFTSTKLNECAITTFKRNKDFKEHELCTEFLYVLGKLTAFAESDKKDIRSVNITSNFGIRISGSAKKPPSYRTLMAGFDELYDSGNCNRSERDLEDDKDEGDGVVDTHPNDLVTKVSRVSKLTDKMNSCPFRAVLTESGITLYRGIEGYSVTNNDTEKWDKCLGYIEAEDWANLELTITAKKLEAAELKDLYSKYGFSVSGGYVVFGEGLGRMKFNGIETLTNRAEHYALTGDEKGFQRISKFIENMTMNPDANVISRIVDFIKWADIEITEEGYLRVYKIVRNDYKDNHSGRVDNSVGSTVFMRRTLVDNNEKNECSNGLHVCALNYFGFFAGSGSRLVSCLLNPEDIVSIPADYNGSKIRCCKYVVEADKTMDYLSGKIKADVVGEFSKKK